MSFGENGHSKSNNEVEYTVVPPDPDRSKEIKKDNRYKFSFRHKFTNVLITTASSIFVVDLGYTLLTHKDSLTLEAIMIEVPLLALAGIISHQRAKSLKLEYNNDEPYLKEIIIERDKETDPQDIIEINRIGDRNKIIVNETNSTRSRIIEYKIEYSKFRTKVGLSIGLACTIALSQIAIKLLPFIK